MKNDIQFKQQKDGSTIVTETITRRMTRGDMVSRYQQLEQEKVFLVMQSKELEERYMKAKSEQDELLKLLGGDLNLTVLKHEQPPEIDVEEKIVD